MTPQRTWPSPAAVHLTAQQRDGLLTDLCGIPCLDGCEVGFAGLPVAVLLWVP
jgi:hypothetical protein